MNIVCILGSCDPGGRTAQAAEALLRGAGAAGAMWELVRLPGEQLERCRQCDDDGWGQCRRQGRCVIDDRMGWVLERCRRADALVFATPVYFSDLSESTRALLDRLRRVTAHPGARRDRLEGKPVMGLCVAGGSGGGACGCAVSLERVLLDCGFEVVDMVPARRQNLEMKKKLLRGTGRWLAGFGPHGQINP